MRLFSLLATAMAGSFSLSKLLEPNAQAYRGPTPPARKKGRIDKSGLPRGYPGAKLARRAMQKGIGVRHHGLRVDGVTC